VRAAAFFLLAAAAAWAQNAPDPQLAGWTFDHPGDACGWTANLHLSAVAVRDGALRGRATGTDPQFVSPKVEIRNQSATRLELRLRADQGGTARFFWAPSLTGRYGGFDPNRVLPFAVAGDGRFHDYVLFPNWGADPILYRLRVDPPVGSTVELAAVRVAAFAASSTPAVPPRWEFNREGHAEGWRALEGGASPEVARGALTVRTTGSVTLASPHAAIVSAKLEWVAVRLKSTSPLPVTVWWTGPGCRGVSTRAIVPAADGAFHVYNLNAGGGGCWWSGPERAGLQFHEGGEYQVDWFRVAALPEGEPELAVDSLSAVRAVNRRGQPFDVACNVVNRGGRPAAGVRATIAVPPGVTVVAAPKELLPLAVGEPQRLVWRLLAGAALDAAIAVRVESGAAAPAVASTTIPVTEPPAVSRAAYVPTPQPAPTPYEIGAYYYPGWWDAARWDPIRRFPARTPVLGFYKEGDPTVADWQIKFAVEHGIRFLAVDWYWRDGKEDLRGLYAGLFAARYRQLLKFCFLYANHDPFNVHDRAEWLTVVRYWLDRYFLRDEFYKIEGKPVVILFAPGNLRAALGGTAEVKRALDAARDLAKARGLPGIYFMGCAGPEAAGLLRLHDEGYDAATGYNYPSAGASHGKRSPYRSMVDGYAEIWDRVRSAGLIDYVIPVSPGWDPRPWHGEDTLVRPGNTPAEFRRMLELARDRMDPNGPPSRRTLLIEAWNEFGEGSSVEPDLEDGFRKLDAVRDVFAPAAGPHTDVAPADVGMPLIEWPAVAPVTRWRFTSPADWKGWSATQVSGQAVSNGRLVLRTTGEDPTLTGPILNLPARRYGKVMVRMAVSADSEAQLFWQTEDAPGLSELRSVRFAAKAGVPVTYELPVRTSPHWRGVITRLRLDPTTRAGVDVQVESVELLP
jgi:hypothetical protein